MRPSTMHEERARSAKVFALVEAADRLARRVGLDPYSDAEAMAGMLERFTAEQRVELAVGCGKRPPSETTWALVVARVRSRAEYAEQDPFARMVSL